MDAWTCDQKSVVPITMRIFFVLQFVAATYAYVQEPLNQADYVSWLDKYGKQVDQPFSGPLSFSHLPYTRCLEDEAAHFDIGIIGMPFDTGVSYRTGYIVRLTMYLCSSCQCSFWTISYSVR